MIEFKMVDLKNQIDRILFSLKARESKINIEELKTIRKNYINAKIELDNLYKNMNELSKSIRTKEQVENNKEQLKELKSKIKVQEKFYEEKKYIFENIVENLPNVLSKDVPIGKNYEDNIEIKRKGSIIFNKHHYEMDIFEDCSDLCGSRFVILKGEFAQLERALSNFMMDYLNKKNFYEFSIPYILKEEGFKLSGHIKEKENMFKVDKNQYLIPTSEALLANIPRGKKYLEKDLPLKFCSLSDCFRSEAGASGKDTKGLIRVHQFKKCEMLCFTTEDKSYNLLEEMVQNSCEILELLEIPYRVLLLCSKDIGNNSAKTYDIEIPIGNQWREVASISNLEEFQTRRSKVKDKKTNKFLHSLNGSALAVGRTLASFLEVHFNAQLNKILIPKNLQKFLNFKEINI